jgi:predicted anti-sigma-YlaC factor YlaD
MRCAECRAAISARLDGEELAGESAAIDAHLSGCGDCRHYLERAARVTRLTRTRVAEENPDLVAAVLATAPPIPRRRRSAFPVRIALGGVGLAQCVLAAGGIALAGAHHGSIELAGASAAHLSHESSAWNLALAVGFLWAALATARPSGLVPIIGAFVGVLTVLSALDVLRGSVDPARLLTHGLVVAGWLLLLILQHITRPDRGRGSTTGRPGDRPAAGHHPLPVLLRELRDGHLGDDGGLQPTARRGAA